MKEEEYRFDIILIKPGKKLDQVAKIFEEVTGLSASEARIFIENYSAAIVKVNASEDEVNVICKKFDSAGAKTEVCPSRFTDNDKQESAQTPEKPSIPIFQDEIVRLKDIAHGINHINTLAHEDVDIPISAIEWLTRKISDPAWNLAMDTLENRWKEAHPEEELPQFLEEHPEES
jgi:hypothetical protein